MSGNGSSVAGGSATEYHTKQVHYLSKDFTYADDGSTPAFYLALDVRGHGLGASIGRRRDRRLDTLER